MSSTLTVDSPPVADAWATAGDRRDAAQQAYRQSVAVGRPLNGVRLGTMFGRSPRWGVDRIAEVRSEDISRSTGSHADTAGSGIGSNGNGRAALANSNGDTPLPIGSGGNGTDPDTGSGPQPSRPNGNGVADPVVPIRSAGNGAHLPIGNNGTRLPVRSAGGGNHPDEPSEERLCQEPPPERRSRSVLDTAITLVVAAVAAAASYGHMLHVAQMAGEPLWIARAFPVTVDGLVLAALRRGEEGRGWLALGAAVSIAANVLAQFPELAATAGPVVSAWPPLALYGTHRLLADRRETRLEQTEGTAR